VIACQQRFEAEVDALCSVCKMIKGRKRQDKSSKLLMKNAHDFISKQKRQWSPFIAVARHPFIVKVQLRQIHVSMPNFCHH